MTVRLSPRPGPAWAGKTITPGVGATRRSRSPVRPARAIARGQNGLLVGQLNLLSVLGAPREGVDAGQSGTGAAGSLATAVRSSMLAGDVRSQHVSERLDRRVQIEPRGRVCILPAKRSACIFAAARSRGPSAVCHLNMGRLDPFSADDRAEKTRAYRGLAPPMPVHPPVLSDPAGAVPASPCPRRSKPTQMWL